MVYNANSGKWNAIMDGAKKLLAVDGCPLCSLTHGMFGERPEWRDLMNAQAASLAPVWDSAEDKVWDDA